MKNILLIGGSYGIGQSIAEHLSKENNIIIASRSADHIPDGCEHRTFDATNDSISDIDLPEKLDGLVFCPGSINLRPFKMLKPRDFEKDLEINFMSLVKVVHGLLPKLKNSDGFGSAFENP